MSSRRRLRHHRSKRLRPRRLVCEPLESRTLLAALEGDVFSLPPQTLETVGLVGNISAKVRWGDGTEAGVPVSTPTVANKIGFKFDYSLDTNNFFNSTRRAALEEVGRSVAQYFTDDLTAISPSGPNTWAAYVCHPSRGASNQLCGVLENVSSRVRSVAANEIVVFAGARDIIGDVRGTGSSGAYSASGTQAWLNTVAGRGQSGALSNPQTDVGVWGGSVSFDNSGTDWYFGEDIAGIGQGQVDFPTAAAHELMHVLGFGLQLPDKTSPWERLTPGSRFNGSNAASAYLGSGAPPVDAAKSHWSQSIKDQGQLTLMRAEISTGERQILTRLDLAAMDDLGWQVAYPDRVAVEADHVYGDNDDYNVDVILKGSVFGEVRNTLVADINNVKPALTVPPSQTVIAGESLPLPQELWEIVDPGYGTNLTNPPTSETFTYTIDWNDGSDRTSGVASVTQVGNPTRNTIATLSASHIYADAGNYQVSVKVSDDDGGEVNESFSVQVIEPPALQLSLSESQIAEDDGNDAGTLTVTRSGPLRDTDQTITLESDDESEATVPGSVVIAAGKTFATVAVDAKDDRLLDGTQTVTFSASGTGVIADDIELSVADAESLLVELTAAAVVENDSSSVELKITRSNTDTNDAVEVTVAGGNANELMMPSPLIIESGKQLVSIRLSPIDDDDPEATERLSYTFSAPNYQGTSIEFDLWDDEPPLFQNPQDRFDVDGRGAVTSGDALRVLNKIGQRQGQSELDPESEQPNGEFVDVTGDYKVTSLDALQVINEVARRRLAGESELITPNTDLALPLQPAASASDDDDMLTLLASDQTHIF